MKEVLQFIDVNKSFGKKKIINKVSFTIQSGEICGLVGANGSGKTTIMKLATNLVLSDSGKIMINGYDLHKDYANAIKNISMCFDKDLLYEHLTGYENLEMYNSLIISNANKIDEVLKKVNMEEYAYKKVNQMSSGMKQRIALARTLLGSPKIILLDEPVNALDPRGMKELYSFIKAMAKEGIAFLISSHMLYDVERNCDTVIMLNNGEVVLHEKISELVLGRSSLEEIYMERC